MGETNRNEWGKRFSAKGGTVKGAETRRGWEEAPTGIQGGRIPYRPDFLKSALTVLTALKQRCCYLIYFFRAGEIKKPQVHTVLQPIPEAEALGVKERRSGDLSRPAGRIPSQPPFLRRPPFLGRTDRPNHPNRFKTEVLLFIFIFFAHVGLRRRSLRRRRVGEKKGDPLWRSPVSFGAGWLPDRMIICILWVAPTPVCVGEYLGLPIHAVVS
jgi:hypothetical protein